MKQQIWAPVAKAHRTLKHKRADVASQPDGQRGRQQAKERDNGTEKRRNDN